MGKEAEVLLSALHVPPFVVKQWMKRAFLLFEQFHRVSNFVLNVSLQESFLFKAHYLASLSYCHFSLSHQPVLYSFTVPSLYSFSGSALELQLDVLVKRDIIGELELILNVAVHQRGLVVLALLLLLRFADPALRGRPHYLLSLPRVLLIVALIGVRLVISSDSS